MNVQRKTLCMFLLGVLVSGDVLAAPPGTKFTYQGQVKRNGLPIDGASDLRFTLWDHATDPQASPPVVEVLNVDVVNGLFTVELDFGSAAFGEARWLGIEIRHPGGSVEAYQPLTPRQPITGAPFALHALSAGDAAWTVNGNEIHNANSGNVGIGTSTPLQKLHVVGRVLAETSGIPLHGTKQGAGTFPGVHGETESTSSDASGTRGYVLSTTPGARSAGVWGRNSGTASNGYGVRGTHDGDGAGVFGEALGVNGFAGFFSGRGHFSGPLGLGTTSPLYPLDVAPDTDQRGIRSSGSVFISKGFEVAGTGLSVSRVIATNPLFLSVRTEIDGNDIDAFSSLLSAGATLQLNPNSDGHVTLAEGGGNVGIGVTSPQRRLQIGDNTEPNSEGMIRLASRSGTQGSNRIWDIGVPETDGDSSGIGYSFIIDDTGLGSEPEVMVKWGTGAVGIGTTDIPTGVRLAVRGKILAEEVEVQLSQNWPDYVFADDYELMPLPDLEQRICEDGRLPGMPPAEEVEGSGLAIGAMQVKLVEKVEELTLYVLQINRELQEVKGRNAQLEQELASLRVGTAGAADRSVGE